ncbi:MAG: diaminobutyrate acetyltransferase [Thermaerobacter sp.]|nr:diaminobutyrate acetyltransferase [Thermaerobacter sp.]
MATVLEWKFRIPRLNDGPRIWELIRDAGTLDLNSPYTYLMLSEFFHDTCIVAESEGQLAGFVAGFRLPTRQTTLFIWQVAVHPNFRRQRLGTIMIQSLLERESLRDIEFLEATVTPENRASDALFHAIADQHDAGCHIRPCFSAEVFPGSAHRPELLYHIGPLR